MQIVLGTTTVDLFLSGLDHMPVPEGDEFRSDNFAFCREPLNLVLGGNGANAAYALAALGATPSLCSALGRDPLGGIAGDWLEEAGVQTDAVVRSDTDATATTTVITDPQRNRQSFHHAGATATFALDDVSTPYFARADQLLVTGYPLLRGWRPDGVTEALRRAHRAGATTLLDIGPAIDAPPTLDELAPLLPDVDHLLGNAYELRTCTDRSALDAAAADVMGAGARTVVAKRGADGATLFRGHAPPAPVPGVEVEVRTTVGAGDAFDAGFLYCLQRDTALPRALRFANATAAGVVAADDGILGAPDVPAVERLMQRSPASE